jgi:hypothetical protein
MKKININKIISLIERFDNLARKENILKILNNKSKGL